MKNLLKSFKKALPLLKNQEAYIGGQNKREVLNENPTAVIEKIPRLFGSKAMVN
jgi:hypothetical protein